MNYRLTSLKLRYLDSENWVACLIGWRDINRKTWQIECGTVLTSPPHGSAYTLIKRGVKMTAFCGLNCSKCDAYLATKEDNDSKREATAQKWSKMYKADIKPAQINCDGCRSDGMRFLHCDMCDIRQCCLSKNVNNCAVCEEYVCETLSRFLKLAPEAGKALERIRSQ
jgi:hypothetical protein